MEMKDIWRNKSESSSSSIPIVVFRDSVLVCWSAVVSCGNFTAEQADTPKQNIVTRVLRGGL